MSNVTTISATTRAALATLRAADKSEDKQQRVLDLKRATAIRDLKVDGHSIRDIVTMLPANGIKPIGRTRVNVLIKAREAAPADVTADDFAPFVAAATKANSRPEKAEKAEKADATVPSGDSEGEGTAAATRPATVDDGIRTLFDLVTAFGSDPKFQAALADALDLVTDAVAA